MSKLLKCPHCRSYLVNLYLVLNLSYVVCQSCAQQYIQSDILYFNIVKKFDKITENQLIQTKNFTKFLQQQQEKNLRLILKNKIVQKKYKSITIQSIQQKKPLQSIYTTSDHYQNMLSMINYKFKQKMIATNQFWQEISNENILKYNYLITMYRLQEKVEALKSVPEQIVMQLKYQLYNLKMNMKEIPSMMNDCRKQKFKAKISYFTDYLKRFKYF